MASTRSLNRLANCHDTNSAVCSMPWPGDRSIRYLGVRQSQHSDPMEPNLQVQNAPCRAKHTSQMPAADFACLTSGEHAVFTFASFSLRQRPLWRSCSPQPHLVAGIQRGERLSPRAPRLRCGASTASTHPFKFNILPYTVAEHTAKQWRWHRIRCSLRRRRYLAEPTIQYGSPTHSVCCPCWAPRRKPVSISQHLSSRHRTPSGSHHHRSTTRKKHAIVGTRLLRLVQDDTPHQGQAGHCCLGRVCLPPVCLDWTPQSGESSASANTRSKRH